MLILSTCTLLIEFGRWLFSEGECVRYKEVHLERGSE